MDFIFRLVAVLAISIGLIACGEQGGDADPVEQPVVAVGDYPQATVDGAMTMFIELLGQGEFLAAIDVCDPTSIEVQEEFPEHATATTFPFEANPNVDEATIAFIREQLSKPYRGSTWAITEETDTQATVSLALIDGRSTDLALIFEDEAWWVFPYEGFLNWAEISISANMKKQSEGE